MKGISRAKRLEVAYYCLPGYAYGEIGEEIVNWITSVAANEPYGLP